MKSKMLLATPKGGGGNFGEYTHIVNVGTSTNPSWNRTYYGFLTAVNNYPAAGSVTPQTFENFPIILISCRSEKTSWGSIGEGFDINVQTKNYDSTTRDFYIGRENLGIAIKAQMGKIGEVGLSLIIHDDPFFTIEDVGKDVPIWLATTPPLVSGLKRATLFRLKYTHSCNCDLFKEVA